MPATIEMKNISKSFGKKLVLNKINLTIQAGQIYGLIGPSGSGKTTLVKLIVGMDQPSTGDVQVLGMAIPNLKVLQKIGYMAQADALYTDLTGAENLSFFATLFKLKKDTRKKRITYAADLVDLSSHLHKKVQNYSGGMKRRLSLAIALIQDPDVLVLDEPTVGIDPELRQSIWAEIDRLKRAGKTILVTTHVMDEAEKCDQLAMIRNGEIITNGSPQQLKQQYGISSLEDVFLQAGGKMA
ncbi:ABC transporter ATP-binding protein [Lederbergia galactosidilytica]|uniref:Glycosyl transferase family 2 n=1 Tax=Lederbergia galactosidilytica TaxID=217031 RepID=A0A0Q9XZA8_9BACI|nr:ABC transporter ATP-binding protein [Lederbergia galactosidilytica]KRG14063.1 glycosyl transferase family 2 [Lederbergia galactosidilytica]KRG16475.1 glycosyl transferase family 2 [Virgibacillus soli]MBP1914197.1 ABC-2 type transport system ATP-binding protein [Lederbergia galactosidilytica]OAK67350.1 glycosyl transferase family 2 [Lederbergia galactosidilytica]